MANPISRRQVVFEKWAALLLGTAIPATGLWVVLVAGGSVAALHVGIIDVTAAVVASWLIAMTFGSIAMAVGAATGRRGVARGIGAVVAVVAYLLSSLAELVRWLQHVRPISPWYHAVGVDPLGGGFQWLHLLILVVLMLGAGTAAVVSFDRRDLGT
jgi:ABC-2 type transport system permease protein